MKSRGLFELLDELGNYIRESGDARQPYALLALGYCFSICVHAGWTFAELAALKLWPVMQAELAGTKHTLELDEGERQALLLALAHLSIERPGWDDMLNRIAVRIDNVKGERAVMYDEFRELHKRAMVEVEEWQTNG